MTLVVDEYISTLPSSDRDIILRMAETVKRICSLAKHSSSYSMPSFRYRGKSLVSLIVRKKHYSLFPFSGKVIEKLKAVLTGFAITTGSIHFTVENTINDALLQRIVEARMHEIDSKFSDKE